ncbi:glycosyltransferase family 2 protein [Chryseobacterium sp. Bi04]|uniref:glycosyltransferase family 2 protein n=1 Tax=Chryseobacterium sp. Bi04 TaxID=2822345 RepID=UPI001DAC113C|nr:glycosyltransferase family 2 protein [Chryseobacterium sp. Bi04]CAH0274564.1 UDP-Glc:alpha-D-GlcNAc-diphosphoundecaprenol beta-1,3-glucosyltransferase WfgD [Chryseobacterium sp. Bi04]
MIDILLATYNGEKFLKEQIDSLKNQSYSDWRLLVHDDGSIDKTIDIIKEYQRNDPRIILIEDGIKFGNAGKNFMHLLSFSTSDFVMFCDQDDIWMHDKIELHYNGIKDKKTPAMIYSNGYIYKNNVNIQIEFITFHRNNIQDSIFLNGGIHGCCVMINKLMLEKINHIFPDYVYMHDHFITILSVTFGETIYIDKPLMLYRQHDNNVTGNIETSFFLRLKTFLNYNNPIIEKRHYNANKSFYETYKLIMDEKKRKLFKDYLRFTEVNIIQRLRIVVRNSFKVISVKNLVLKTLLRKPI